MKSLLFALLFAASSLNAKEVVTRLDPKGESIKIEEKGDWVFVSLKTQTMAGQRLIFAWPESFAGQKEIYLDYYFIQNIAASYRHIEPVTVTWKIMKIDWDNWHNENTLFIRKKDDVTLTPEQVRIIKDNWKL
jgi:hypothetical protein